MEEKIKELLRKWYVKGQLDGMRTVDVVINEVNFETMTVEEIEEEMNKDLSDLLASPSNE